MKKLFRFNLIATMVVAIAFGTFHFLNAYDNLPPGGEKPECGAGSNGVRVPAPNTCKWYWVCLNGVAFAIQCKDGLYYDPGSERCDTAIPDGCEDKEETKYIKKEVEVLCPISVWEDHNTGVLVEIIVDTYPDIRIDCEENEKGGRCRPKKACR